MKSEKEVKNLKYPELQKYASVLEEELGVDIDRSAKKVDLLEAVLDAMTKAPKTEEPEIPEITEETKETEDVADETPEEPETKKRALWVATKVYSDWESGIEFDPGDPEKNKPFEIPKMTSGLKEAMRKGTIVLAD